MNTRPLVQSLLLSALCLSFFSPAPARAQSCMNDNLMMVDEYVECECDCLDEAPIKQKKPAKRTAHAVKRHANRVAHKTAKRTVAQKTIKRTVAQNAQLPHNVGGTDANTTASKTVAKSGSPTVQQVARQAAMKVVAETVRQADNFANIQKQLQRLKTLAHQSPVSEPAPHRI